METTQIARNHFGSLKNIYLMFKNREHKQYFFTLIMTGSAKSLDELTFVKQMLILVAL